jgi:hypothetical protein
MVIGKRESVPGIEPPVIGMAPVFSFSNRNHIISFHDCLMLEPCHRNHSRGNRPAGSFNPLPSSPFVPFLTVEQRFKQDNALSVTTKSR